MTYHSILLQRLTVWMMNPVQTRIPQPPGETDRWISLNDLPRVLTPIIARHELSGVLTYGLNHKVLEFYTNPATGELGLHLITNRFGLGADLEREEAA